MDLSNNARRVSTGRGGAGNIRRPSEAILPDLPEGYGERRRSSVWSSTSSDSTSSKKSTLLGSIKHIFTKSNPKNNPKVDVESKEDML